jgi:hypothetical protein
MCYDLGMSDENTNKDEINEVLMALSLELSEVQKTWAHHYIAGLSPIDAIIKTGLGGGKRSEQVRLSRDMLQNPNIKQYIDEMRRHSIRKSSLTLEALDERWEEIANVSITDIAEIGALYQPLNDEGLPTGTPMQVITIKSLDDLTIAQRMAIKKIKPCSGGIEIELYDRTKALDMLTRRRGGLTEKHTVEHQGNLQIVAFVGDNGRGNTSE